MTKEQFIENFTTQFVATWTAQNYNNFCSIGKQERLEYPPVVDAVFLAKKIWPNIKEELDRVD